MIREFPLVPLKNIVVFPRTRVNLTIVRPRSVQAVREADRASHIFVATKQRQSETDDPQTDDLFAVASLVQIISLQPHENGIQLIVEGLHRVQIEEWLTRDPFIKVAARRIAEPTTNSLTAQALVRHAHELFERYLQLNRRGAPDPETIAGLRSASKLADVLAASITTNNDRQQELLETINPEERLEKVCVLLGNEIEVLDLDRKIRERVREQVDKNQQEYYLKEQIKAVQRELGIDSANEAQELRDRAAAKGMPVDIEARVEREISRLERMPQNSAEVGVLRSYIDWMLAVPWQERSEDRLDIAAAERVLDEDHYGLERVKDRILDFLAVRQRRMAQVSENGDAIPLSTREAGRSPILCLIGPPGVGKTSLGESIAHAMNRKFVRISLGGVHDEAEIRGHRRTYVSALPGRIIHAMKTVGVRNPVFLLDEIDKLASDYRGDPAAALLEVLDPAQNHTFTDHYLEVPYDLSSVFFICTGNNRYSIPKALADRMEIIEISGYTEEEKLAIARRYIWPRVLRENVLEPDHVQISDKVLRWVIASYTREAGVRSLERQLDGICRKVARRLLSEKDSAHLRITQKLVEKYLGVPRYSPDEGMESDQVGVAMGLAWTEHGGTLLPVEVAVMPGHGQINLTGQQGEVMQESARTAISYIRTRARELDISPTFADQLDMHIHLPEGAIPKDGPSAGITMATAMISALTGRPVRSDTAMTGEITLRGRVLPIGGLRDKVLAAHRIGIRRIILPVENRKDLGDIPDRVRDAITFVFVARMDDVEREALLADPILVMTTGLGDPESLVALGRGDAGAPDSRAAEAPIETSPDEHLDQPSHL